jgi:hypothetical protein
MLTEQVSMSVVAKTHATAVHRASPPGLRKMATAIHWQASRTGLDAIFFEELCEIYR